MAEVVDSCCVPAAMAAQLTKPDKNNNTTANVDDDISLPSEQCDGVDEKSDSTGDTDDHRLSSGVDDDGNTTNAIAAVATPLPTDDIEVPIAVESTANNNSHPNTSTTNHVSNADPYKDFSGVDTESFISTTLRNNPKDRTLLLTLETVLRQFIQADEQTSHQFQAMNSYERMIVHRVAAFFGLDHNVDKNGQAVVVTKTPNTRIPELSFQKCIPEDEAADSIAAASAIESNTVASSLTGAFSSADVPTRRILRRHEKSSNHDHLSRNGLGDDSQFSSTNKHQPLAKPYLERVSNYAETRARIFNETPNANTDQANATMPTKSNKINAKPNTYAPRPSYRKQHQNSSYQNRAYVYPHSQVASTNHHQQYATGKNMDPSSHMLNPSTTRTAPMYSAHPITAANMSMAQPPIYASMVTSNPGATSIRAPVAASFYTQSPQPHQQQSVEYDYKQQIGGAHIYNYVPMIPPTGANFIHHQQQQQPPQTPQQQQQQQPLHSQSMGAGTANNPNQVPSQHGTSMQMPILVHQQPTGQIQYIFPAQALSHQQQHAPTNPNSYSMTADGQFVQIYRPDGLPVTGAVSSVMDGAGGHHHAHHHHPYPPTASFHQHPHHHALSQQQQVPSAQSNAAQQPPAMVRVYQTAAPANVSHPYAQASYPTGAPPSATFVQPGSMPPGSFMMPPQQNSGGVQTYSTFDNGASYAAYGPASAASNAAGKPNMSNNNGSAVQYAANHLSTLALQNQHDEYQARLINSSQTRFTHSNGSTVNHHHQQQQQQQRNFMGRPLVQSPNGSANTPRMTMYPTSNHAYRPSRPYNLANTDKQTPSNENDPKSLSNTQQSNNITMSNSSDTLAPAGPAQGKE